MRLRNCATAGRENGPEHGAVTPATHGVLRSCSNSTANSSPRLTRTWVICIARRKIAENMTYTQFIPYTDRLDYLAPLANNVAYALRGWKNCLALKEFAAAMPYIRVMCCELARIPRTCSASAHLDWTRRGHSFSAHIHGARKDLQPLRITHRARFTTNYTRIGGVSRDTRRVVRRRPRVPQRSRRQHREMETLLTRPIASGWTAPGTWRDPPGRGD